MLIHLQSLLHCLDIVVLGSTRSWGTRKEFFSFVVPEIYKKYFKNGLREHISEYYYIAGIILGNSIYSLHKLLHFYIHVL